MTPDDFSAHVRRALDELGVASEIAVQQVKAEAADGVSPARWTADLRLTARPDTAVTIAIVDGLDEAKHMRELRGELRRALRMCPLCQRIGHVEKIRDAQGQPEACAVRCPACGAYEIDQALIRELRSAWERNDRDILDRLPTVSDATQRGDAPRLTGANWRDVD